MVASGEALYGLKAGAFGLLHKPLAKHRQNDMKPNRQIIDLKHLAESRYRLRRGLGLWEVVESRSAGNIQHPTSTIEQAENGQRPMADHENGACYRSNRFCGPI